MYAEGNPVIESPLSFATCIHDMLLQSWDGKIRVFPGTPGQWGDVAFHQLRTQGAFLVSAQKKSGITEFVSVESLIGSPCIIKTDISNPKIYINGVLATSDQVHQTADGFREINLDKGDSVILSRNTIEKTDLQIKAIPVKDTHRNLFGLSQKTLRLPGHRFYFKEQRK